MKYIQIVYEVGSGQIVTITQNNTLLKQNQQRNSHCLGKMKQYMDYLKTTETLWFARQCQKLGDYMQQIKMRIPGSEFDLLIKSVLLHGVNRINCVPHCTLLPVELYIGEAKIQQLFD